MRDDAFMMDVENALLEAYLGKPPFQLAGEVAKGTARLRDRKWMAHAAMRIKDWYGGGPSRHELAAQGADAKTFGSLISACVRHGQSQRAVALVEDAYGLPGAGLAPNNVRVLENTC